MQNKYKQIEIYNNLWESQQIQEPLIILIGGYAGTGKSTLSTELKKYLPYTDSLATGHVRAILRKYISSKQNPYLHYHTYNLHTHTPKLNLTSKNELIQRFEEQIRPVAECLNNTIDFALTEHQRLIIDGNHVFPPYVDKISSLQIEIYLKVSDPTQHYKMLCGPTHARRLTTEQFNVCRILHDYTETKCKKYHKIISEYNTPINKHLEYIDSKIGDFLSNKNSMS